MMEFSAEKNEEKFNFINEKVFQNLYMSLKIILIRLIKCMTLLFLLKL